MFCTHHSGLARTFAVSGGGEVIQQHLQKVQLVLWQAVIHAAARILDDSRAQELLLTHLLSRWLSHCRQGLIANMPC